MIKSFQGLDNLYQISDDDLKLDYLWLSMQLFWIEDHIYIGKSFLSSE